MAEGTWYEYFKRDFNHKVDLRPSPVPWYRFYIQNMNLDFMKGLHFAKKLAKTITDLADDSLTTIQDLVLSGDVETSIYQIEKEMSRTSGKKFTLTSQNSLLQFAILSGRHDMVTMLLERAAQKPQQSDKSEEEEGEGEREEKIITSEGIQVVKREVGENKDVSVEEWINRGDLVTGFTPLHFAVFTQNPQLLALFIEHGADMEVKDNFFGTPLDYARMLRFIPRNLSVKSIKLWNGKEVEELSIEAFEKQFNVEYCNEILCTEEYIEELMFSGFNISSVDEAFRKKYFPLIYESSGEENLILAKVNDEVGYGVYAGKDFQEGEFIVRYGGILCSSKSVKDVSYAMSSGVEGVRLNAMHYRNLGGMINHSTSPNAESQCAFDRGAEQAIITAKCFIPKGQQILIDYSVNFWKKNTKTVYQTDLSKLDPLPI